MFGLVQCMFEDEEGDNMAQVGVEPMLTAAAAGLLSQAGCAIQRACTGIGTVTRLAVPMPHVTALLTAWQVSDGTCSFHRSERAQAFYNT